MRRHDSVMLIVRKLDDLTSLIIPFFDRYELYGQKRRNYELWKQAVALMVRGEHRSGPGFEKILELKAQINQYQGQDEFETDDKSVDSDNLGDPQ